MVSLYISFLWRGNWNGRGSAISRTLKMENVLRAERQGRVKRVAAKAGDSLALDQLILEFE